MFHMIRIAMTLQILGLVFAAFNYDISPLPSFVPHSSDSSLSLLLLTLFEFNSIVVKPIEDATIVAVIISIVLQIQKSSDHYWLPRASLPLLSPMLPSASSLHFQVSFTSCCICIKLIPDM